MRGRGLVVLWVLSACACLPRKAQPPSIPPEVTLQDPTTPEAELLGPTAVARKLDSSKVTYNLLQLEEMDPPAMERYAVEMWSPVAPELDFPVVKLSPTGERRVERYPVNETADRLIAEAEPHYRQGRLAQAAALYQRALQVQPSYYPALLDLGDVAFRSGDHPSALARYDRAIQVSPLDHRGHYLRANALVELGRPAEALDSYATALTLRPRHPQVLDAIQARQQKLGVRVVRGFFLPRGLARPALRSVDVFIDTASPHWVAWTACKAMWIGEEQHRRELTGDAEHRFTPLEEVECLGALLQGYLDARAGGDVEEEPDLERIGRIGAAGHLPELILYELASRKLPHATLLVEDNRRAKVVRFIRRFAFEKQGPGPKYEVKR